ncbi:MAG TPA: DUF2914 domain-containing protein [Geobacteraceae bacterium]|nr:DUF2914 domain-containing protein [Geobacteraceae bacterium]
MKPQSLMFVLVLLFLGIPSSKTTAEVTDFKITEMTITSRIYRGNPIDRVRRASSRSFKGLYCFTRIESPSEEDTSLKHVWYLNGDVVAEYTLPVRGKHWRTYSKKLFEEGSKGNWRIEAWDSAGNLLKTVEFRMN